MAKTTNQKFEEKMQSMRLESELAASAQDTKSRSRIAYMFAFGFVGIIILILVGGSIYNATIGRDMPIDVTATLKEFMALFGTPLGFVLGYYFKDKG